MPHYHTVPQMLNNVWRKTSSSCWTTSSELLFQKVPYQKKTITNQTSFYYQGHLLYKHLCWILSTGAYTVQTCYCVTCTPDMVEVILFDEQVNINRPDVNSSGIVTQNTFQHCPASFYISILDFILGELHYHINVYIIMIEI